MDYLPEPALTLPSYRTPGGNAAFHNFNNDYSHITDPNRRRRLALAEIDKVPFGWYHVRAVVVAGIGFFTDSYDIFAINLITSMLGMVGGLLYQCQSYTHSLRCTGRALLPPDRIQEAITAFYRPLLPRRLRLRLLAEQSSVSWDLDGSQTSLEDGRCTDLNWP